MQGATKHPAIAAAFATVDEDRAFTLCGFLVREDDAAAVLLSDGATRCVVIVENRAGRWQSPTMLGETEWNPSERPSVTDEPWAIGQASFSQSGWPGPDGMPPTTAWLAVSGLAATDALSVVLTTDLESHEVAVTGDGVVLALVRAPWRARPKITVRTTCGDEVARTAP